MLFVSCMKSNKPDNVYWSCEQLLDTAGLKLYPFVPFTDEEMRTLPYFEEKLPRRQIPEDFLHGMTAKELFYQVVYTDLSQSMVLFNTRQQGFMAVTLQLNMLPELLNRPDAGIVLLEMLYNIDPAQIEGLDCNWAYHCLNIIGAQPEIINRMADGDICSYIDQQMRCNDAIRSLNNGYPANATLLLFGLGNVMIRYEFQPFIQTLDRHPVTNELCWDTQFINEQYALQIIDYVKQFKKQIKK